MSRKGQVIKIGGHKVKRSSLDDGLLDKINKALGTTGCNSGCCSDVHSRILVGHNNCIDVHNKHIGVRNVNKYGVGRKGCMGSWKSKNVNR